MIGIHVTGANGPDVFPHKGQYDPPPGAFDIPGIEVAGEVVSAGSAAHRFKRGDLVCALVTGGGYAEYVVAQSPRHDEAGRIRPPVYQTFALENACGAAHELIDSGVHIGEIVLTTTAHRAA
ncbi:alcohol dehydrogenase GroES-like domain protein [Burkholderia multivorans]|nr:alcohol dehydrogenase GroES-like domain protein [Burkholderia multivorans]